MDELPKHLGMTQRQFMAYKRRQFKNLCAVIDNSDIRLASAYLPRKQFKMLSEGIDLIFKARKELRPWWKKA